MSPPILPKAREIAKGKWREILPRLGFPAKFLDGNSHPCPRSGEGRDRFCFKDREGSGNYFCHCDEVAREGRSNGVSLLMCYHGWDFRQACEEVEKIAGQARPQPPTISDDERAKRSIARMKQIVSTCAPCGDAVTTYLASRGLNPSPALRQGRAEYWETSGARPVSLGQFDVMVASIRTPSGKAEAIHVTYIANGRKANVPQPKKVIARSPPGSAIRLVDGIGDEMGIAEGIENALSASILYSVPTWASYSANRLELFVPPPGVKRLWIFGDNDSSAVGQIAAYKLMQRMGEIGIEADVVLPKRKGMDFNDMLLERKEAA